MKLTLLNLPLMALAWYVGGWPWAVFDGHTRRLAAGIESRCADHLSTGRVLDSGILVHRRPPILLPVHDAAGCVCVLHPLADLVRVLASAGIVEVFLGIRMWQDASREVLIFETVVAVAILGVGLAIASGQLRKNAVWIAAAGSLLAFISLAL